ncbi:MAG: hypothetical protein BGN88_05275 [Clostridiales bacterium 43-6]|nr:MAG: hypothetical protein BGN88_05275 [Clostridiales bacterium 43-6]
MIKKILCIWFVVALMVMPVFATGFTDIDDESPYFEQINILEALGVVSAKDDASFRVDDTMSKGEFTNLVISNLMRFNTDSDEIKQVFKDVPESQKYAASIYRAYCMGLIANSSDSLFGVDIPIKAIEAIKILVSALGYTTYAEAKGGFPTGYIAQANSLKLLNKLSIDFSAEIKRGEVAQLLYNALEVDLMSVNSIGDQVSYSVTKGCNVLTEFLSCNEVEGIVNRVYNTSITNPNLTLQKNVAYIGDDLYKTGATNAADLLGYHVTAYYSFTNDSDDKVLVYIAKSRNTELTIQAELIHSYNNLTLTYSNDDFDTLDREIKLSNKADFILNGKAWIDAPVSGSLTDYGAVTVVDNDSDGKYNVVIVTSYDDYVVSSISTKDQVIYSKTADKAGSKRLDLSDITDENLVILDVDGKELPFNTIKEEDVLTVKMSPDNLACTIYVCSDKIEGTITEISDDEVEIDYLTKTIVPTFKDTFRSFTVGFKGIFYIDAFGGVAGVVDEADVNFKYGYLVKIVQPKGIKNNTQVKIYTKEGKMIIVDADNKICINNIKNKETADLVSTFTTTAGGVEYTKMQVIKYRLGADNTLKEITGSNLLQEVPIGDTKWNQEPRSFGSLVLTSSDTAWFIVPKAIETDANSVRDTNFSVKTNLSDSTIYLNEFFAYDIDDGGVAAVLLRKVGFSTDSPIGGLDSDMPIDTSAYVMVSSISSSINKDGETVPKINFIERGVLTGYVAKNENVAKKYQYKTTNGTYNYVANATDGDTILITDTTLPPKFLERGDIIQYKLNDDKEIVGVKIMHDMSRETSGYEKMVINSDGQKTYPNKWLMRSGENRGFVYGTVKSQKNGFIKVQSRRYYPVDDPFNLYAYNVKASPITVYDVAKGEIYKGSFGDITDEKNAGVGSKVYIHNHWYRTTEVFIYKNLVEKP